MNNLFYFHWDFSSHFIKFNQTKRFSFFT